MCSMVFSQIDVKVETIGMFCFICFNHFQLKNVCRGNKFDLSQASILFIYFDHVCVCVCVSPPGIIPAGDTEVNSPLLFLT